MFQWKNYTYDGIKKIQFSFLKLDVVGAG